MSKYIGLILAVIGATVLAYLAILPFVLLPPEGSSRWPSIFGLLTLSLIIGVIVNVGPFLTVRYSERSRRKAEQLYRTVQGRLVPLLIGGLEDTLRRRAALLTESLNGHPGCERNLKFYVFAQVEGYHRVIASTVDVNALTRRIKLKPDSGIVGVAFNRKVSIYADSIHETGTIYDRYFKSIGKQRQIDESTLEKCDTDVKWINAVPIFESGQDVPWSDKVIGMLTVDSTQEEDAALFQNPAFQNEMEDIAADVAPYLAVFEEIK